VTLELFFHPLSSYSHKALVALYEGAIPFEPRLLEDPDSEVWKRFRSLWPIGKFPTLRIEAEDRTIPEATIIIEFLAERYPAAAHLIPADPDLARQTRLRDRFFDLYVMGSMQRIMDHARSAPDATDPVGVRMAEERLATAYDMIARELADGRPWIMGDGFTMADCAAAASLFYADRAFSFTATHPDVAAYLDRLKARPSYARALKEAEPYFGLLPK